MKKIYITPVCEMQGKVDIQMFCASKGSIQGFTDDELEITWEGEDKDGLEADGNKAVWDHFDKGL